jgi:hypothetical protein
MGTVNGDSADDRKSESTNGGFGVYGEGVGPGVVGVSKTWHGVSEEGNWSLIDNRLGSYG